MAAASPFATDRQALVAELRGHGCPLRDVAVNSEADKRSGAESRNVLRTGDSWVLRERLLIQEDDDSRIDLIGL
jgi:hypothetical protein